MSTQLVPMSRDQERTLSGLVHIFVGISSFTGGLLGVVAAGAIWLFANGRSDQVVRQAVRGLYFSAVMFVASAVVSIFAAVTCGVGALLFLPLTLIGALFPILAGANALGGGGCGYGPLEPLFPESLRES